MSHYYFDMKNLLFTMALFLLNVCCCFGNCYYISTMGDDNSNGTFQTPFKTLQKALDVIEAGDTVFLRGGTYSNVSHQYGNNFLKDKTGNFDKPIVIMAYEGETPIIDGSLFSVTTTSDPSLAVILMWNVKHMIIDGLTVINGKRTGIHFVGQCENITVKNCTIKDCKAPGIGFGGFDAPYNLCKNIKVTNNDVINCAQSYREAISLRWVENFEISYNKLSNIVKEGIDVKSGCSNGSIFENTIINGGDVGIYVDAGFTNTSPLHNIHIYNNRLINPVGTAIAIASEEGNEGYDIHVYNNLIYDLNKSQGAGIKVAKNSAGNNDGYIHDVFIYNNTVYGRGQQGLYVNLGGVENIVFRNNISMNNLLQMSINIANGVDSTEVVVENNLYYGDVAYIGTNAIIVTDSSAVFKNLEASDFHLRENSPAIDACGNNTMVPPTDIDGNSRPIGNGYDIGCYEYTSTSNPDNFICTSPIFDVDSNKYETIQIGNLCWMKSNIRTTKYANGNPIAKALIYNSDQHSDTNTNLTTYGRLYTWPSSVNTPESGIVPPVRDSNGYVQGICPNGWHIPTIEEFEQLSINSTESLRSTEFWLHPNNNNNSTGFSALPSGMYAKTVNCYEGLLEEALYWSDSSDTREYAVVCSIFYGCNTTHYSQFHTHNAISVRCVKTL